MKKPCSWFVMLALLSGAMVSACGAGVEAPDTSGPEEDTRSEQKLPLVESDYAIYPVVPLGGETFSAGQTVTIEWAIITGSGLGREGLLADAIRLELYQAGHYHSTIVESVPTDLWTYSWQVPADIATGSSYSIRLSNVADPTLVSGGPYFTLVGPSCTFRFEAASLFVARDQRTATINYEGKLELAGVFLVNSVSTPRFPATGVASMSQGATLPLDLYIADVQVLAPTTVSIRALLWESENGGQGDTDTGTTAGSMDLNCTQSVESRDLSVTLSADSSLEREGRVVVKIRATRL